MKNFGLSNKRQLNLRFVLQQYSKYQDNLNLNIFNMLQLGIIDS